MLLLTDSTTDSGAACMPLSYSKGMLFLVLDAFSCENGSLFLIVSQRCRWYRPFVEEIPILGDGVIE